MTKTTVQDAAPAQPVALTDEQIEDLRAEANRGMCIDRDDYFKAFRDAEFIHGIGRAAPVAPEPAEAVSDEAILALVLEHDGVLWQRPYLGGQWRLSEESLLAFARAILALAGTQAAAEPPLNDKSHPRFMAGYDAGLHDRELEAAAVEPAPFESMQQAYDQGFAHGQHDTKIRVAEPVEGAEPAQWCNFCGEGVTTFCRGKLIAGQECSLSLAAPEAGAGDQS
jgi:hypothetical protein